MQTNDWKEKLGLIVANDPSMQEEINRLQAEAPKETKGKKKQHFVIELDKAGRKGKQATLIMGFDGDEEELKELAAMLKRACGVGGSCRDGEILIQGDLREKVKQLLTDYYQESGVKVVCR